MSTTTTTPKELKNLKDIASDTCRRSLFRLVASDALDEENPMDYLRNDCEHIIDGCVNRLIYYADTHAFFDKYYDDILSAVYANEVSTGEKISPDGEIKNWYAWFAYEYAAREIVIEIDAQNNE